MIIQESRIKNSRPNDVLSGPTYLCGASMESYVFGYFLTIDDLKKLLDDYGRDKQNDNMISLDTLTKPYIETWMSNHNQIVKNK